MPRIHEAGVTVGGGPMQLGIRTKFIGILIIAAVLPLCIGIAAVWVLGAHHYRKEKGVLFEALASHLSQSLNQTVNEQIEELDSWLILSGLHQEIHNINAQLPTLSDEDFQARIAKIEETWPGRPDDSPEVLAVTTNPIAEALIRFQRYHPLFAEVFVTDKLGQLVAASEKTSDYWQADEQWWQRGRRVAFRKVYAEGINFDDSANVYSIDVVIPILNHDYPDQPPVGVLKAVLNITPLFSRIYSISSDPQPTRQVVDADGRIVYQLFTENVVPYQHQLRPEGFAAIQRRKPGWTTVSLMTDDRELVGYSPLNLTGALTDENVPFGIRPLFIIVHQSSAAILLPVRRQLAVITFAGIALIGVFSLAGLYIAGKKIIRPIRMLRTAAQEIASTAKLQDESVAGADLVDTSAPSLGAVQKIKTADEIEDLAHDFSSMARRVLSYHEQLEEEIASKTAEIQRDLEFAREFQEALLPRSYPRVPSEHVTDPISLNFHHIYKPASTVGGDFFDVLKLSDHRAGIFIADVMGHGARSALVTAILRTLLQDLSKQADDPAKFLELINQHFYDLVQQSDQFIFVSAFYLIIDTQKAIATYASAGHPPPFMADRSRSRVTPLIQHLENNPALGLFRNSAYTSFTSFIKPGDMFILFTDGLFEATNPKGEEFGQERLRNVIEQNISSGMVDLSQVLINQVNEFIGTGSVADDICLVTVEVFSSVKKPAPRQTQTSATR